MVDHHDTGIAIHGRRPAAQELAQVDNGEQLSAYIREPLDPGFRSRHPGHAGGHAQHLASFLSSHQVKITCHAQCNANPFAPGGPLRGHLCGNCAAPPLELREEIERSVA